MSGLARLSHISRSVALSMLGYSCLAHSYWQRCHKTGDARGHKWWGGSGGEANQERTICMSTRLLPSGSLSTSLTSLHYPLLCQGYKCQDIRLPQAVSLGFSPEQHDVRLEESKKKTAGGGGERWVEKELAIRLKKRSFNLSCCHCQLKTFSFHGPTRHTAFFFFFNLYSS